MPVVILLVGMRLLPLKAAELAARAVIRAYLLFSRPARDQLARAQKSLGTGSSVFIKTASANLALMSKAGTSFSRRLSRLAEVEGEEHLMGMRKAKQGAVAATFHLGPWELVPEVFAQKGYRVAALVGRQRMGMLDKYLGALRARAGVLAARDLVEAYRLINRGGFLAGFLDKTRRGKRRSIGLPFGDYLISQLPGLLALRTKASLIPFACRFEDGRLRIKIGAPGEDLAGFFAPVFKKNPDQWLVWGR